MHAYSDHGLRLAPKSFAHILRALSADALDRHTDPDRFTVREVIAHLADWEPILRGRIESALSEDNPAIQSYDESERAISQNYSAQDPWVALENWQRERAKTADLCKSLTAEQWSRPFTHPERGRMTVETMASFLHGHDHYHLEQISALLEPKVAGTW